MTKRFKKKKPSRKKKKYTLHYYSIKVEDARIHAYSGENPHLTAEFVNACHSRGIGIANLSNEELKILIGELLLEYDMYFEPSHPSLLRRYTFTNWIKYIYSSR